MPKKKPVDDCPRLGFGQCSAQERITSLEAERDQLRAELAECREDAERYRHVRTNPAMLLHLSNAANNRPP